MISRYTPPMCRFYPSCSKYAVSAMHQHGFGLWPLLSLRRIMRCHPFHPGGYDRT